MGFVTPFAGGSETRPAGPDAGLRGARCPGGGRSYIRRRCHEARDRTEPRPKGFGESRGRAPEGERVRQKRRAPRTRPAATLRLRGAASGMRLSALRLPLSLFGRSLLRCLTNLGRNKTRRENGIACIRPRDAGRATTRSVVEGASDSTLRFRLNSFRHGPRPSHRAACAARSPLPASRGGMKQQPPVNHIRFNSVNHRTAARRPVLVVAWPGGRQGRRARSGRGGRRCRVVAERSA
jgi:hypothetical protein